MLETLNGLDAQILRRFKVCAAKLSNNKAKRVVRFLSFE